ncbi:MAG TPA: hypothetical protein PKB06_10120 [Actinotalea sp.]|mgnify:CR=1 FL=1|nr:hypothetical protein [Actinotalea sp.]
MPILEYGGRVLHNIGRIHDAVYRNAANETILVEIKMGIGARSARQIAADAARIAGSDVSIEWHYVMSAWTNRIGPSVSNLNKLAEAGIPVVIHFPLS